MCPPDPPKTSFSRNVAAKMVELSSAAYEDVPSPNPIILEGFKLNFTTNPATCLLLDVPLFGYIGKSDSKKEIYVAFRGSNFKQIAQQLLVEIFSSGSAAWPPGFPGVLVGNYFLAGAALVSKCGMTDAISKIVLDNPTYSVWFTGHSLGGALTVLTALDCRLSGIVNQSQIYTFGQPRIGNGVFANVVDSFLPNLYRVVNDVDPVPHVPQCDLTNSDRYSVCQNSSGWNPFHHGKEIWFACGDYTSCVYRECVGKPFGEDISCSDHMTVFQGSIPLTSIINVKEHMVQSYYTVINQFGCITK